MLKEEQVTKEETVLKVTTVKRNIIDQVRHWPMRTTLPAPAPELEDDPKGLMGGHRFEVGSTNSPYRLDIGWYIDRSDNCKYVLFLHAGNLYKRMGDWIQEFPKGLKQLFVS